MTEQKEYGMNDAFIIFPKIPSVMISSALVPNVPNEESTVHTFIVPKNTTVYISEGPDQEVLFEPIDGAGPGGTKRIVDRGTIRVYVNHMNGEVEMIYECDVKKHLEGDERKSPGDGASRRRWKKTLTLNPGDRIRTTLYSPEVIEVGHPGAKTYKSHLAHMVALKKGPDFVGWEI